MWLILPVIFSAAAKTVPAPSALLMLQQALRCNDRKSCSPGKVTHPTYEHSLPTGVNLLRHTLYRVFTGMKLARPWRCEQQRVATTTFGIPLNCERERAYDEYPAQIPHEGHAINAAVQ